MKKNVRKFLGGLFAVALLAGFVSCSNSTGSDLLDEDLTPATNDVYSGDELTFTATCDSKSTRDVNLVIKYDRTVIGAKEQIALVDSELEVTYNGTKINMPSTLKFELEEYSSLDANYVSGTSERRSAYQKEYKIKLPLNTKITTGGVLKVQLKSAKITGEGYALVDLSGVSASLIDNSEEANWYTELSDTEYQSLITKKNGHGLDESDGADEVESNYKVYKVTLNKDIADASEIGLLLQADNDGSQDADGLKIDVTNLELRVKIGSEESVIVRKDSVSLVPNQWASPSFSKTDARFRLGLSGAIANGTEIEIQAVKADVSNPEKTESIIFALQRDTDPYDIVAECWSPIFVEE